MAKKRQPKPKSTEKTAADESAARAGFPIVGVGASAGGLEALNELLQHMRIDTGMAFVIVTHQHPGHTSLLPELLAKKTGMPVVEAADGLKVEPNHVYIGRSGGHLAILNGTLHHMDTGAKESPKLPIDYFFRSLAEDQKENAICIVLSGTGTDGTLGLKAVKGESGMAMVEQPQSAKYAGMPSSAIATGLADYVLPPRDMPQQLMAYGKGPYLKGAAVAEETPVISHEPMQKILVLLRTRTGHDFSGYKSNTLRRRIERRLNVHQIETPKQYVRYLQENPHEIDILFKELLISVTNFFRDPDAWTALASPLRELITAQPDGYTIRAWAPGCSSGEEVYSMAILIRECMEEVKRHCEVQIFGTDLDAKAIETARLGRYPDGIAVDVPPKRLKRYFVRDDSSYRIRTEIREMAIFAPQNVIKDPPFTKMDIISCRNLLIYLNSDLQKKLLPIFHYALKPGGLLFLGPSETISSFTDLYETLDKRWKIYRRKESTAAIHVLPEIPAQPVTREEEEAAFSAAPTAQRGHVAAIIERVLLGRFAPTSVVVNDRGDIIYIHGRTGAYLEPAQGQPRNNILEMTREGLQFELASAMRKCVTKNTDVVLENLRVKGNGEFTHINLTVTKLHEPETVHGLLLVTFRPTPPAPKSPSNSKRKRTTASGGNRIEQLERELQYAKESHQTALEELETSNEELKSTNEELQSTNEELETSKEEMQSLNEELTTVNAELQSKLEDLSQANDDMQNLLNSSDIATVFLDNDLNIKRFTEQATELVMLRPTDVGRPISELASNLAYDNLAVDCREVLKTLVFKEADVKTNNGADFLMRITPYRTTDNAIDGLVLTFVNIERLKRAEHAISAARTYFESIVDTVREPLVVLTGELRVMSANGSFYRAFDTTAKQTEGKLIYELSAGNWNIPKLRELLEEILPENTKFENYEVELETPKLGRRVFALNARRLKQPATADNLILLALEDTTK